MQKGTRMIVNNCLKFLLHIRRHNDNYDLIRKFCSQVTSNKQYSARSHRFQYYKNLVINHMRLNNKSAIEFLRANDYILRIPEIRIQRHCKICERYGIDLTTVPKKYELFSINENELKSRILILREIGVKKIYPTMLNSSTHLVNTKLFKFYANIDHNADIAINLYSHLHIPPLTVEPLKNLNDDMSLRAFRSECLSHYLRWRLNIGSDQDTLLKKIVESLINTNFSKIRDSFDILHEEVGLSIETIRDENLLAICSPEDLRKILGRIQIICGIPVIQLIKFAPMLSAMKYSNARIVKRLLRKYRYTGDQLKNCVQIFFVDPDQLCKNILLMQKKMELRIIRNHPEALHLVLLKDQLGVRIDYLGYLNMRNATVKMLKKSNEVFERSLKSGKLHKGMDEIIWMIHKYANLDKNDIYKYLGRHPFWNKVDFLTIDETLQFVLTVFSQKDVMKNLSIILYPKNKVAKTLRELSKKYHFLESKNEHTTAQILALCEYEMEKNHHFTGDGVWDRVTVDFGALEYSQFMGQLFDKKARENLCKNNRSDRTYDSDDMDDVINNSNGIDEEDYNDDNDSDDSDDDDHDNDNISNTGSVIKLNR